MLAAPAAMASTPIRRYTSSRSRGTLVGAAAAVRRRPGGGGGGGRGGGGGGGGPVLLSKDGSSVFFQGTVNDRNPQQVGPKTFIDQVAIKTGEKTRIFESDNNGVWERVSTILDPETRRFIITKEGPTDRAAAVPDGERRAEAADATTRTCTRTSPRWSSSGSRSSAPDGFKFRVTVNLPHDYQKGTRLPAFFWFYPRELHDPGGVRRAGPDVQQEPVPELRQPVEGVLRAARLRGGRERRADLRTAGADEQQLRPRPAHEPVGRRSTSSIGARWSDRTRLAIGGHSYGAFSTVNAMVHTPFFKAGIAGDGAYNRTLTPLGFQTERRDLWEAPNVYLNMSPFLLGQQPDGRAADVSRPARPERRHRSDQLDPAVPRAERARARRWRSTCIRTRITGRRRRKRCSTCGRAGPPGSTST